MGEESKPVEVFVLQDGKPIRLGLANSIEFSADFEEESYTARGVDEEGNEIGLVKMVSRSPTKPLTMEIELTQFNLDFLLEISTPLMRHEDYRFVLGTQSENGVSWDYGDADDLIKFLSLLLRQHDNDSVSCLFYQCFSNPYQVGVEVLDGSNYTPYSGLTSITLGGYEVTPTAPLLFRVVNFLCTYKADAELILDGVRLRLEVSRIEDEEEDN